ncbi:MAG: hypothetical protein H8E75_06920, partial [Puniceicoccaceae bacterium]|nr:hypothetical protein [Puniceicoccaceae bacterium]
MAAIVQASQFAQLGIEQARALHPIAESKNPMPTRHFLRSSDTLSQQVAQHLSGMETAGTLLIAPTGGAARRHPQLPRASGQKAPAPAPPTPAPPPHPGRPAPPDARCPAPAGALRPLPA